MTVADAPAPSSRHVWLARAIPLLPAAGLAVCGLAVYLETRLWLVAKFPYFLDEGILASYAQLGLDPNKRLASLDDGIRPGLVWLTMGGMKLHFDPLRSIRLVVVGFGLILVVAGTILLWRYASRVAAAAFAVLAIFTPFLFIYGALGFRDPAIAALMIAGFLLEIELARNPRVLLGLALGVTFALDILIKDSGKVALYLLPLSLVYFPFRSPQRFRLAGAWIGNVVLALLMTLAATLPMRLTLAYKNLGITERVYGVTRPWSQILHHPIVDFNQSWPAVRGELSSYLTYPIVVLAIVGLGLGLRHPPRFTALVAVWAIAQLAAAIWVAANTYARYLVPAVPFILILAGLGVDELVRLATAIFGARRRVAVASAVVGLALLVPALVFDAQASYHPAAAPFPPGDKYGFITGYSSGLGTNEAIDELQRLANGKPLVVIWDRDQQSVLQLRAPLRGLNVTWPTAKDPLAVSAKYLLTNGAPVPAGVGRFREIWSYQRPDHGVPLRLYQRLG